MVADALFALFLAGVLPARIRWWLKYSPPVSAADIRQFCRQLSRSVYLVLYLIIGAKQLVGIIGGLNAEGGLGQDPGMLVPTNQGFLVYGLIALVLIRVLAYLTWRSIVCNNGVRSAARRHGADGVEYASRADVEL